MLLIRTITTKSMKRNSNCPLKRSGQDPIHEQYKAKQTLVYEGTRLGGVICSETFSTDVSSDLLYAVKI